MFVEKRERRTEQFNLHDESDLERLRVLFNDPRITVLNKDKMVLKESMFDGEVTTSRDEMNVFIDYEICSL